jgi:DNA-binding NtrC family response regulator
MAGVLALAAKFAILPRPLLITGEPGTGKTRLARRIHELSGRPGGFMSLGCRVLALETGMAELCGHTTGAFTGAVRDRKGLLETHNRGTLSLEELGIATEAVQEMLLQVLEDGNVRRLGDDRSRPLDVRFIATTNEDLEAALAKGTLRADLLDRFGPFRLAVPPLRERREEILPLARHFIARAAAECGRLVPRLMPDAIRALRDAAWVGNVRELNKACAYAVAVEDEGRPITAASLPPLGDGAPRSRPRLTLETVREMVDRAGGNVARAARENGWSERQLRRVLAMGRGWGMGIPQTAVAVHRKLDAPPNAD